MRVEGVTWSATELRAHMKEDGKCQVGSASLYTICCVVKSSGLPFCFDFFTFIGR